MSSGNNIKLKPDAAMRRKLYTPESFSHPAKAHLGMMMEIIERYTKPGDWILDPLAGIGSTMLGALMGRNIICVELESHFITPMKASWVKMRQSPMLGRELGQVVILQGDARCLPLGRVDAICTSPPYEESYSRWGDEQNELMVDKGLQGKYTRPSAIITSPPYEGSLVQPENGIDENKLQQPYGPNSQFARPQNYTRPAAIITSPPYEAQISDESSRYRIYANGGKGNEASYTRLQVDAVVTSPPFQDQEATKAGKFANPEQSAAIQSANYRSGASKGHFASPEAILRAMNKQQPYAPGNAENIGNLRGEKYWESMRQVYSECHRVLKPSGLLVLVLKGFTRAGKYINLPLQTRQCCEALGFQFVEQWQREIWNLSFWRILQRRRDPVAFDDRLRYESVICLQKML